MEKDNPRKTIPYIETYFRGYTTKFAPPEVVNQRDNEGEKFENICLQKFDVYSLGMTYLKAVL